MLRIRGQIACSQVVEVEQAEWSVLEKLNNTAKCRTGRQKIGRKEKD